MMPNYMIVTKVVIIVGIILVLSRNLPVVIIGMILSIVGFSIFINGYRKNKK